MYYQKIIHVFSLKQLKVFLILFLVIVESSFTQSFKDVKLLNLNICQGEKNVFKAVSIDCAEQPHEMNATTGKKIIFLVMNGTGFIEGFDRDKRRMREAERGGHSEYIVYNL